MIENKNYPVDVYTFSGSHRQMGRMQGRRLRKMIRHGRRMLAEAEEISLLKPSWMPIDVFILIGSIKTWLEYSPHIRKFYPEQYKRLRAIARGAATTEGYITFLNSFEVEMNKANYRIGACSAAGVAPHRSASGEPLIYKNFDYPAHFSSVFATRLDKPAGRNQVISVTAAPCAGNHDGINDKGLAIAYNYGYGQDETKYNIPITILVQEALETCSTTEEAVEMLTRSRRGGGALLMICDADGDLCAFEMSNNSSAVRRLDDGFIAHTNHYHDPALAEIDIPEEAYYDDNNVAAVRGKRCMESTEKRYDRLIELLGGLEKISDDDMLAAFSDHGPGGGGSDNTICRHSDYFTTTCSVAFYPAQKRIRVMYGSPCSGTYRELGF